jgi:putative endonuclease
MPYTTYILYSESLDRYYTGSCEDIETRLIQHNSARNTSTKTGIPWILKYTETFDTRAQALSREREIKKKKSRKYIEWLINPAV